MEPSDRPPLDRPSSDRPSLDHASEIDSALMGRARMPAANADEDQEIWLLSYSDLVTLLLSVFVMLLAMTTLKDQLPTKPMPPDAPAVGVAAPPPSERPPLFDDAPPLPPLVQPALQAPEPPDPRPRLNPDEVAVTAPERLAQRWRERLTELGAPTAVTVSVQQNRVAISIGDAILFAPGQAELTPPGHAILRRLAATLIAARGDIIIEGHTDVTPVANQRFPSNWELSGARASSVVRRLIDLGVPATRLSAVGFADTRPLGPGGDPASLARNRRVAISLQADE